MDIHQTGSISSGQVAVRETSENVGVRSSEPRWTVCTRSVSNPVSRVSRVYRPAQIHELASDSLSEVICKYVDTNGSYWGV